MSNTIKIKFKDRNSERTISKPKRDKLLLLSYDEICKLMGIDYKCILYFDHPKLKYISIYNKEDWNFLYNFGFIEECFNKEKNMIYIHYMQENLKSVKQKKEEKIESATKVIKYIIENFDIKPLFSLDTLIQFKDYNKESFKNFWLTELIKFKTNTSEMNINNNIYSINSKDLIDLLEKKIKEQSKNKEDKKEESLNTSSDSIKSILFQNDDKENEKKDLLKKITEDEYKRELDIYKKQIKNDLSSFLKMNIS